MIDSRCRPLLGLAETAPKQRTQLVLDAMRRDTQGSALEIQPNYLTISYQTPVIPIEDSVKYRYTNARFLNLTSSGVSKHERLIS
jgi:hypothetical protein